MNPAMNVSASEECDWFELLSQEGGCLRMKGRLRCCAIFPAVNTIVCGAAWMASRGWIPEQWLLARSAFWIMAVIDYPIYLVFGGIAWFFASFAIIFLGNTIVGGAWWYMIGRLLDSSIQRRAISRRAKM